MGRVVITGIGIYSCLGTTLEDVRDSLYNGKSGIIFDQSRKDTGFRSALTGNVQRPQLKGILSRRERIQMHEPAEYAYMATKQALDMAGIDQDYIDSVEDFGIIFGNDSTAQSVMESVDKFRKVKDSTLLGSGSVFQGMNSTVTMNLATIFKLTGANYTLSAACASGSHSIGLGYHLIKSGLQEAVVCGGAQEVNQEAFVAFDALGTFSMRENDPTAASRPFDKDRDGLVPSGGGASVILESLESAQKRGAKILGEVVGYGFSSNGAHISTPTVEGPVRALNKSLVQSGLSAKEIHYINAHATSTPIGDANEARAIFDAFGGSGPYVSSTKSLTGHECWMSGASEIVYSMLMMLYDFIAPNINFDNPDEASAKINIAEKTVDQKIDAFLSNSFGFGGTNASLVIKKFN